ncbi:uncharacterized protein [Choristoneura fumiferana]|uniref:uncharacterized protein n=1 Tax=Choristoneura fumiferana TaxID=7141 RepID=UPI003D15D5DA
MNNKVAFIVVVVSCLAPVQGFRWFHIWWQAKAGIINRMVQLMRTIYVKLDERITSLHGEKFRFDTSKEFEEGYLMSVIIEKYRQAVEHTKFSSRMKAFKLYDIELRLEMVQILYIEIYRLVNMMHEIPRKYGYDIRKRKRSTVKGNPEELLWRLKDSNLKR